MANKGVVFKGTSSYYHRFKSFDSRTGKTRYGKKGGFQTEAAAEKSYYEYEEAYKKAYRAYHVSSYTEFDLSEYLLFWLEEIYRIRTENTTYMIASYVVHGLLIPNMGDSRIKLQTVSVEYLDALLQEVSKCSSSAGNKARELLNVAFKDAVSHGYIQSNPVSQTKKYKRRKPHVTILSKERLKVFLKVAKDNSFYCEILLALFCGLRKGEIFGLRWNDIDFEMKTLTVSRQVTANPIILKGSSDINEYQVVEKSPKSDNAYRTLMIPEVVVIELKKRKKIIEQRKNDLGKSYYDHDYVSAQKNGNAHAMSSFNNALTKLCNRNGLPHLTPHSLRHMYATILLEQNVSLAIVSKMLGHKSVATTFDYYAEVMDENDKIISFLNDTFCIYGGAEND